MARGNNVPPNAVIKRMKYKSDNPEDEKMMAAEPESVYRTSAIGAQMMPQSLSKSEVEHNLYLEKSLITDEELEHDFISLDDFDHQLTHLINNRFDARQ